MNNYSEQIFQSIDTIISQRLNEVKFDRTITCEVIAGVKDYPNKYWVSDGATKFQACVADSSRTYTEKQKVYVLIPNGDYNSADKVIIGSYTADELPKNLYTNPFDHLVYSSKVSFGPYALDKYIETSIDTESLVLLDEQDITFNYSNTTPFDYIGLDFSFNTTDLYGMKKGNYGIQFTLKNKDTEIFTSAIDSSQLYGDIYNLNSLMKMQHLFPIPVGVDITQANELVINLYQKGNFDIAKKKIYLKEASFYFGYDVEKINSNKLILHLDKSQSLIFKENEDEEKLKRKLYLEWQDTDLNKIYSFDQEQPSSEKYNYTIYWCKYIPGYKKGNGDIEETGVYWKTIETNSFSQEIKLKPQNNSQQFKVGIKYRNQEEAQKLIDQQTKEKKAVIQDTSLTDEKKQKRINEIEEKYKKLIDALWKYLESNVLIFTNEDVKPEPGSTNNSEDSIKLTCSDSGVYNYYTYTGNIVDTSYLTQERTITATFLDGYDFPNPDPESNNIKWIIPTENTMISKIATGISNDKKSAYLKYKITNNYWPGIKENNTITCEVKFPNGEIRRGRIALLFGGESAVGSEYFFNIYFADNKYSLQYNKKDSLKVKVAFGRRDGEKISVKPTISWEVLNPAGITPLTGTGEEFILNREATSAITSNFAILKAFTDENYQLDNGLTARFEAYLPIPLSGEGHHISGPTKIVYDTTNSNLKRYSNKPYVLYDKDNKEIAGISWEIYYDKGTADNPNPYPIDYPVLKNNKLYPIANALDNMPVVCVNAIKNNIVIWSQPIYFSKYRWEFGLLNNWSGKLTIDKEQNAIMAATLVAGKKADDNSFTGVVMGEMVNSSTKEPLESGLYGFEKGVSRFYLNNAGAFFVGKDNNYISFNDTTKGTLNELEIRAENFDLISNNLNISSINGIYVGEKIKIAPDGQVKLSGLNIYPNKIFIEGEKKDKFLEYTYTDTDVKFIQSILIGTGNIQTMQQAFKAQAAGQGTITLIDMTYANRHVLGVQESAFYQTTFSINPNNSEKFLSVINKTSMKSTGMDETETIERDIVTIGAFGLQAKSVFADQLYVNTKEASSGAEQKGYVLGVTRSNLKVGNYTLNICNGIIIGIT